MDPIKRNYLLMCMDSILFANAMTFISVNAFIAYFLNELGASTFQIGVAGALVSVGVISSQPFFVQKVINLACKLNTFVKYMLIQRSLFLLFVLTIPLFAVSSPSLMVICFLLFWMIFNFFVGSYAPFYMSLFAKMIAVQQRGRVRGFSLAVGNLLALGSSYIAGVILKEVAFPYNYTIIFGIGALILLADTLIFALMKEEPDQVTPIEMSFFQYFKSIPATFRENPKFKRIVIGFCFMLASQVSLVYYALYAVRVYEITPQYVALFTALTGIINIVSNILFGIIADKYGHRLILLISSLCAAAAGVIMVSFHQLSAVYAAFSLTTFGFSGYFLSSGVFIIEHVAKEKISMCISVNSLITLMVSAVATLTGSFLIDNVSFQSVFVLAGAAGLVSSVILYDFKRNTTSLTVSGK